MRARSPAAWASRSMTAILLAARWLQAATCSCSSVHAGASVAPGASRCVLVDKTRDATPANSRKVGMPPWPGSSSTRESASGNDVQGAINARSAVASWHCRTRACAHTLAPSGPAASRAASSSAAVAIDAMDRRAATRVRGGTSMAKVRASSTAVISLRSGASAALAASASASPIPMKSLDPTIFSSARASSPCRRVSKCPARLPLSTLEI